MKQRFKIFITSTMLVILFVMNIPAMFVYATEADTASADSVAEITDTTIANPEGTDVTNIVQSNLTPGWPQGPDIDGQAAIIMDADTGAILYEKNIDEELYPASITKIMTILVALEYGNLDDVVTFSYDAVMSIEPGSAHIGIREGEQLTLRECLNALMLASANEVANGIAEHIGGSIEGFVVMMNEKAAELGCQHTHFTNPHGLHEENHYTSAYDMALITKAALQDPDFLVFAGLKTCTIPKTNLVDEERPLANHHKMLLDNTPYTYEGTLGGKTGFTDAALNTLVTVTERNNIKLICVTLKVNGAEKNYETTTELCDYIYNNFSLVAISQNDPTLKRPLYEQLFYGIYDLKHPATLVTITGRDALLLPNGTSFDNLQFTVTFDQQIPAVDPIRSYFFNGRFVGRTTAHYELPIPIKDKNTKEITDANDAINAISSAADGEEQFSTAITETTMLTELETDTDAKHQDTGNDLLDILYKIKHNKLYLLIFVASIVILMMVIIATVMLIKSHRIEKRRSQKKNKEE